MRVFKTTALLFLLSIVFCFISVQSASAAILLQDDFEDPARSASLWNVSAYSPNFLNIVMDPSKAISGSGVLEMPYRQYSTGPGYMARAFSATPEVYIRWYERYQPGWQWSGNGQKILFVNRGFGSIASGGLLVRTMWGGDQPRIGLDSFPGNPPDLFQNVGPGVGLGDGQWHCLELQVKPASNLIKLWIDGNLKMDHRNVSFPFNSVDAIAPSAYYNCIDIQDKTTCVPQFQYRWMDEVVVSDQPIGCLSSISSPPSSKPGDLNNDSKIDIQDIGILLSNWGKTTKPPSDLNQDSKVDVVDLGILLSNWG